MIQNSRAPATHMGDYEAPASSLMPGPVLAIMVIQGVNQMKDLCLSHSQTL